MRVKFIKRTKNKRLKRKGLLIVSYTGISLKASSPKFTVELKRNITEAGVKVKNKEL